MLLLVGSLCSGARQMVDHLWLLQRPSIHSLTHPYTETQSNTQIHQMYPRALWFLSVCVFVYFCVWPHFCNCVYQCIHTTACMLQCVPVCLFEVILCELVANRQPERKKHRRNQIKLDLTVSIGVGGKFDCSLQVVAGFDISSSLSLTICQTKQGLQELPNVKRGNKRGRQ